MEQRPSRLSGYCELSDQQLSAVIDQLAGQSDLTGIDAYKASCVKRRIAARIRRCGCENPGQYLERLITDPDEGDRLVASLSIHVSQFFRNATLFDALQKKVLPKLLTCLAGRIVRFWSIGCSAGQEPYSLAMLLAESFAREAGQGQFEILATDIDAGMLARAEAGRYDKQGLHGVSPERLERFFSADDRGFSLRQEIRCLVRFSRMDLQQLEQYQSADLVLCRNTLIYFNRPAQEKILHAIADILPQGGILVLGKSESMPTSLRSRFATLDPTERMYSLT